VEGFEGVIGVSVPVDFQGFGHPPAGFHFSSGLTFLAPNPNPPFDFLIGDFSQGNAMYGLGASGRIQGPGDLHGGTAYAAAGGDVGTFRFGFDNPVNLVGVFASSFQVQPGQERQPITLSIFDTAGILIESDVFTSIPPPPLRDGNFIGVGSTTPIGSFTISSPLPFFVFDDVMFESTAIPEPTTLTLFVVGALGLVGCGWRRRTKVDKARP
jgi:hypothetical protein